MPRRSPIGSAAARSCSAAFVNSRNAPAAGHGQTHTPSSATSRTPSRSSQRKMHSVSSISAAAFGGGTGETTSAAASMASTYGCGCDWGGLTAAPASRPWRMACSSQPPSGRRAAATSCRTAARPKTRWARCAARNRVARRSRWCAASSYHSRAASRSMRSVTPRTTSPGSPENARRTRSAMTA
jgi:hypothetical protein